MANQMNFTIIRKLNKLALFYVGCELYYKNVSSKIYIYSLLHNSETIFRNISIFKCTVS